MGFIAGLNKKNERSWREMYENYYQPLCSHAFKILKEKEVAADIVQNTFVRIWEGEVKFIDSRAFTAYVYKAVHNNSLQYIRNKNAEDERLALWGEISEDLSHETFASIVEEEVIRKLKAIIANFPQKQKEVIRLTLDGLKVKEIAEKMQVSPNTVKTQKSRAFKTIREMIGKDIFSLLILFTGS